MRIIGGRHRSRRLAAPAGTAARPTADRARQALFDILAHGGFSDDGTSPIVGARVLDGFAGSGALGLEALSRGAAHVTAMDDEAAACAAVRANAKALDEAARVTVVRADATKPPVAPITCALVFLDPPYGSGLAAPALTALAARGWIADRAVCVVEIEAREEFAPPPGFARIDERRYGKAKFLLLRYEAPSTP